MPFQFSHIEWFHSLRDYYVWYDNGSGWYQAAPHAFPIHADTAEDALGMAGCAGYGAVATLYREHDPNRNKSFIVARN